MDADANLKELYQEVILDHNKNPRNFGDLDDPKVDTHAYNPLCGDDYHLSMRLGSNGLIEAIKFSGKGCAISKSSASMLTARVKGKKPTEASNLQKTFLDFITSAAHIQDCQSHLGNLMIFEGVRNFPSRIKCATMIWHALGELLQQLQNNEHQKGK
ncbi:MAG: nitrogen fixation NifU-like protein [Candidatus Omnitrophota bacterium]|jgi:nitrogen fixation NifU-like protein